MGCEVFAFSHSSNKEAECKKMGVNHYVLDSPGFHQNYQYHLDLIISTRDATEGKLPYLRTPGMPLIKPKIRFPSARISFVSHLIRPLGPLLEVINMLSITYRLCSWPRPIHSYHYNPPRGIRGQADLLYQHGKPICSA